MLHVALSHALVAREATVKRWQGCYEVDFLGFSYGFRPERGPHHALDTLAVGIGRKRVNWVFSVDIGDFFTSLDQSWLESKLVGEVS
jgi:retron-type reverse transcriptase